MPGKRSPTFEWRSTTSPVCSVTDSTIPSDLRQALQELGNASRAVADLAEFLERNPKLVVGRKKRAKEQQ
jgi:hypothetical protein